jgi:hypothetical protein
MVGLILRALSPWGSLLWAALPLALGAQGAPSPPATPAVDTLLAAAGIPSVLAGFGGVVEAQLTRTAPSLPPERAARAREVVSRHFAGEALYRAVATAFAGETSPERLSELYAWVTTGPVGDARRIAAAYTPPLAIEEFAAGLADLPPPQTRVLAMLRLSRAQGAGPLFLTLAEAARGAANTAARALDPELPPFRGLPEEQVTLALDRHDQQSVLLYLHRYATLSDELLAEVAERYESEIGQWYVTTVSQVVRDAVLTAAERAADELRSSAPPRPGRSLDALDAASGRGLYLPR